MRNNVDGDRNFCEKNIRVGKCALVAPKPLYAIATEYNTGEQHYGINKQTSYDS
jgi:hypothetical protein